MKLFAHTPRPAVRRLALTMAIAVLGSFQATHAQAAATMLLGSTDMVTGTASATISFQVPSAGTLLAEVSSVPWPVPLSALSFNVSSAAAELMGSSRAQALAVGSSTLAGIQAPTETYQVTPGTYFLHVTATADGPLNVGLFSALVSLTPAVPLPASLSMLLGGGLLLWGLGKTRRELPAVACH